MKKSLRIIIPFLVALLIAAPLFLLGGDDEPTVPVIAAPSPDGVSTVEPSGGDSGDIGDPFPSVPLRSTVDGELRAVWVSSVINLDYPSKTGLTAAEMKAEAIAILDGAVDLGFNAVIFQVRPCGDALYKSDLFPWSEYLTGIQGQDPGFDPLAFWVDEAHARGLELHAWLNPYRVSRGSHELGSLAPDNPARQHPEWVVMHIDGNMYFDPGVAEVREMLADCAREIVENYAVDGLHFDDYFYPDGGLDDASTYAASGSSLALDDWRRANVDALIAELYQVAHSRDGVVFGVSPFGIWANAASNPLGSDTNGNQSYYSHFADTRGWVKSGIIDYICPQLYWNIGFQIADYSVLLDWWADTVRGTDVKLYVGHADYRAGNEDRSSAWFGTAEIRRQLELNKTYPEVSGSFHFRYSFFESYPALGAMVRNYHLAASLPDDYPLMPQDEWDGGIVVGRPAVDLTTSFTKYYVVGRCDPSQPLTLNGRAVDGVTESGYFGVMVPLDSGENTLVFEQDGTSFTRVITRGTSSAAPPTLDKAEILQSSAYPSDADIYIQPGEKITLRCTAPIGADVTVTLAGNTYKLNPSDTKPPRNDGAIYSTAYSYTYTMGEYATGKVHTVGRPVYSMTYNGESSSVSAGGMLRCIGDDAPFYAVVSGDAAFLYSKASTQGGNVGEIPHGMVDYITGITTNGHWIRLKSGFWVERDYVDRVHGTAALRAVLSAVSYSVGDTYDRVVFSADSAAITTVSLDGDVFTVGIRYTDSAPPLSLPDGTLLSAVSNWYDGGVAWYRFTLRDASALDGYWLECGAGTIELVLKRKPSLADGDKPLDGFVIMIDAGHGGSELGALGPLGIEKSERIIALAIAEKVKYELEALGAEIVMCRTDDSTVGLYDRLIHSRAVRPDLLISIHLNAVDENVDATNIHGVSTWYRENLSADFNRVLAHYIAGATGLYDRGANKSNLYICRGTWCPSTIVECGFICCPQDFEWLMNDTEQAVFARAVAGGVIEYFR